MARLSPLVVVLAFAGLTVVLWPVRPATADSESYVATLISPLAGDTNAAATALGSTGLVAGFSSSGSAFADTPILWTPVSPNLANGTETTLPTSGLAAFQPLCINDKGNIGGNDFVTGRTMLIIHNGTTRKLKPPYEVAVIYAINDKNIVLVYYGGVAAAYNYDENTYTVLPLATGYAYDTATAINDSGAAIGYAFNNIDLSDAVAVFWPSVTSTPQVISTAQSLGTGLNANDQAVLENDLIGSDSYGDFSYWSVATGVIAPDIAAPYGLFINDDDVVIGMDYPDNTPFMWTPSGGYADLSDSMPFTVYNTYGFNAAGQILAEQNNYPENSFYLLTPNVMVSSVTVPKGTTVVGPKAFGVVVTLAHPVFVNTVVKLSSNSPAITVPTKVTILAGETTGSFTAKALAVTSSTDVLLTATANGPYGPTSGSVTVTVDP